MMKISQINLAIFAIPLFLSACHGGSNGSSTDTASTNNAVVVQDHKPELEASVPISLTSAPIAPKVTDEGITRVEQLDLEHLNKKDVEADNSRQPSVGWVSSLKTYALDSCWDYSLTLEDGRIQGDSSLNRNASTIQKSFGLTSSLSAKFGALGEASADFNMKNLTASQSEAVNVGSIASYIGMMAVHVEGLSTIGKSILENHPTQFYNFCGDQVVKQVPVMNNASYLLTYRFESSKTNKEINTDVKAKASFVDASAHVNTKVNSDSSNTSVSIARKIFVSGKVDTTVLDAAEADLVGCVNNDSKSQAACLHGLSKLTKAVTDGFEVAKSKLEAANGKNADWKSDFSIDYARTPQLISSDDQLKLLGEHPVNAISNIGPYNNVVKHNIAVLQDLYTAQRMINTIGDAISKFPRDFATSLTPYPDNRTLAMAYSNALDHGVSELHNTIKNCLDAANTEQIDTQCGKLDPDASVLGMFNKTYEGRPEAPIKEAVGQTIKALIYIDEVSSDIQNSKVSVINSHLVYVPAKPNEKLSPFIMVTVPINFGQQVLPDGTPIYISAFQNLVTPAANWGDTFVGNWNMQSQSASGVLGWYNGNEEILYGALNNKLTSAYGISLYSLASLQLVQQVINTSQSSGIGSQTCNAFASSSNGCQYTVQNYFSPAITMDSDSVLPPKVTQKIVDTYNAQLRAQTGELFGTNQFNTLYPFYTSNGR